MTIKYFIACFLICLTHAQTTPRASDVLNNVENEFVEIGKKISEGFDEAGEAIVNEYHKVEDAMKEAGTAIADEYHRVEHAVEEEYESLKTAVLNACACTSYNCGCCAHLEEAQIELNATICTNISYLVHDYGISFTVTVNGYAIFNETVSARNPPPVCLGMPYVKELADVCVRLYDINATTTYLHACVRIEARMKMILIAKYDLGCFNIGPPGVISEAVDMIGKEFKTLESDIQAVFERTESMFTTQNIPNVRPLLFVDSDIDDLDETSDNMFQDSNTYTRVNYERVVVKANDTGSGVLIPVLASLGAIVLICIVTLVLYIGIKKRRGEQQAMLQYMKQYGSTNSLLPHVDPYC